MHCSQCTHNKGFCILGNPETQLSLFPDSWEHGIFSDAFGFSGRQLPEEHSCLPSSLALKKSLTDAVQQVVDLWGAPACMKSHTLDEL